jgi:hypothetical protein
MEDDGVSNDAISELREELARLQRVNRAQDLAITMIASYLKDETGNFSHYVRHNLDGLMASLQEVPGKHDATTHRYMEQYAHAALILKCVD